MKILVTGGAGFIGSHLVDKLIKNGHRVCVIDDLSFGKKEYVNKKAKLYIAKIESPKIAQIFKKEKPEVVFHLAAQLDNQISAKDPVLDGRINVLGGLNVLQNCVNFGIRKIVFFSSAAVYGDAKIFPTKETDPVLPIYPYGIAKLSMEKYIEFFHKIYELDYTIFRPSNAYGPRQSAKGEGGVIAIFGQRMTANKDVNIYGSGKQTRDFIYVDDIVDACVKSLKDKRSAIYNLATQNETSVNDLFEKIKGLTSFENKANRLPGHKGEQFRSVLSNSKSKRNLKWQAKVDIDKGLSKTIKWFKQNS